MVLMWVLTVYFMLVPLVLGYFILKHRERLCLHEMQDKFLNLYKGINVGRSRFTVLYHPMTMMRRTIFVAIPTFLPHSPWL